jgi:hypothetical protein
VEVFDPASTRVFRHVYLLETPNRDVFLRPGVPPLESLLLVNDADDLANIFWRSWWLAASLSLLLAVLAVFSLCNGSLSAANQHAEIRERSSSTFCFGRAHHSIRGVPRMNNEVKMR